ncbi:MAG: Alkaline phosphatase; Type I phosphodiesterase/nucleotide pyrophosphatase precursor [uncultured Adhaeribacter sp.]|uniref:Alkaline phosphatase Type I phosphodiesterase/nucleotide pyrophosphatase n=1 Tax=uncultured Adhaeribacter sp. TaxID=448109 RepID=A0A6J4I2R0_9BACT|nr:MAG: Alkaline phosphatase; Type I phosphodiesterase/nucleotide pyrophosphatase precursor [uncultured Adhaeribacter sp.]
MKLKGIFLLYFLIIFSASAQKRTSNNTGLPRPKLVVGLMVDQMRWDFIYRYYDRYQQNGFKRLLNEGFSCDNTNIDYTTTVTGIGHSTVYTGSVPALHGIAGNDFILQATGKTMYCTEDDSVEPVGSTSVAGKMSPRNLLAGTITDELKLATNFRSKVIGIALKDRGSILPAGHTANAAYWFDDASANWITSTWYLKELPAWVQQFNAQKLAEKYLQQNWNTLYPLNTYVQSTPDNNRYEGAFKGAAGPVFPVNTAEIYRTSGVGIIRSTPYGNTFTLDLAKAALEHEQLGQSGVTDFLAVSLSSPDYIGHQFGPNAVEIEDTYLRLDKDLADFFTALDKKLGKGNYTVFLTADHGASHNPNFLIDKKLPGGSWPSGTILKDLNNFLETKYKVKNIALSFSNYQISLNNLTIGTNKLDESAIRKDCVQFMEKQTGVAYAVDIKEAQMASIPDALRQRMINAYNPERSGVIQLFLKPGWFSGSANGTGTSHGTWSPQDSHIPLIWMGWGIKPGKTARPVNMSDITPTLAALLRIQVPGGSIGQPILEVLK